MKKIIAFLIFMVFLTSVVFAEFQLESSIGYFFNTDTYDSINRSFNGLNLNITPRYFFTENIGLFFGGDFKAWFNANNNEYIKQFENSGMNVTIDDTLGFKLDLNVGLALALPINQKFGLQSDLGISFTVLYIESITGNITTMGYSMSYGIFPDKVSSMGFYSSIFGRYLISESGNKGYLTFGIRMDFKFNRDESGEVIVAGVSQKYSGNEPNFFGFSIAPFIGYMGSY